MLQNLIILLKQFLDAHVVLAPLIFVISHVVFAVFLLPCSPLTLLAGTMWGGLMGFAISFLAAALSTSTTFMLSRTVFRSRIEASAMKRYPALLHHLTSVGLQDWKLIAATYLNPGVPSSAAGYLFGLTNIRFPRFILISSTFMLPLQFLYVFAGDSVGGLASLGGPISLMLSGLFFIIALFCVPSIARQLHHRLGLENEK